MKFLLSIISPFLFLGCKTSSSNHWINKLANTYSIQNDPFCDCSKIDHLHKTSQIFVDSLNSFQIKLDSSWNVEIIEEDFENFSHQKTIYINNKEDTTSSLIIYIESLLHPSDSLIQFRDSILSHPGGWQEINYGKDTLLWRGSAHRTKPGHWPGQKVIYKDFTCSLTFKYFQNRKWYFLSIVTTNHSEDKYNRNFQCGFKKAIESFATF